MSCEEFGLAIIDDAAPRPEGLEAHLRACPNCQGLASAHRSAQRLRNLRIDLPARSRSVSARRLWRRRLALRGTFAGMGVAAVAALLLTAAREDASLHRARAASLSSSAARTEPLRPAVQRESLEDLLHEVNSYTRQDVLSTDETLEAFGELPDLLTPTAHAQSATSRDSHTGGHR